MQRRVQSGRQNFKEMLFAQRAGQFGGGIGGGTCDGSAARCGGLVSSSAIIRRMEARISSIEGSWAFAACAITTSPRQPRADRDGFGAV